MTEPIIPIYVCQNQHVGQIFIFYGTQKYVCYFIVKYLKCEKMYYL